MLVFADKNEALRRVSSENATVFAGALVAFVEAPITTLSLFIPCSNVAVARLCCLLVDLRLRLWKALEGSIRAFVELKGSLNGLCGECTIKAARPLKLHRPFQQLDRAIYWMTTVALVKETVILSTVLFLATP